MKQIKAKELANTKWRIKPADRLNLTTQENNKIISSHLSKFAEVMEANIKILDKFSENMDKNVHQDKNVQARHPTPAPITPNVEVIVPPPKEIKKSFRVTPVRDDDGRILYVDIQQL